jgi:membrane protease subunit HflK
MAVAVTRERLYLETMDRVLPKTTKFIMDGGSDRGGVVPLLPLRDFMPASVPPPPQSETKDESPRPLGAQR